MAFEIVDGMTGTKHISSDDLSALNIATIGESNCVLNYGDNFKLTMTNANTATLGTGVGMVGGKRFWNQANTNLTIKSGTQGQKRNDLVVARYAKTSAGIESITPVVIKGTPTTGTAADPEVTANDLKLWRVPLDGISVGEPVKLFEPVASLATIVDSVTPSYFSSKGTGKLTVVAQREGIIEVEAWYENQWGYDGKDASISLRCPPGLVELVRVDGSIYGGNIVGRSMHALLVASGARSGESYTFTVDLVGSVARGIKHIFARCL